MAQGFVKPLTLLPSDWVTGEAILPGALFPRYGTYTPTPRAAEVCSCHAWHVGFGPGLETRLSRSGL